MVRGQAAPERLTNGRADTRERLAGSCDRLAPRDPDHALAVRLEQSLPFGVVLPGDRVVVPRAAIGLDDEPLHGPAEVGYDPTAGNQERLVRIWRRQPPADDQVNAASR